MRGLASWRKRYTSDIDSVDLGKKKSPRIAFGMQECVQQSYRVCKHMCTWTQFLCRCTGTIIYLCYSHTVHTFTVWLNASCLHITMTTNSAWLTSFIWVCVCSHYFSQSNNISSKSISQYYWLQGAAWLSPPHKQQTANLLCVHHLHMHCSNMEAAQLMCPVTEL